MRTRVLTAFGAVIFLFAAACGGSADAVEGGEAPTTTSVGTASSDPAWDDNAAVAAVIGECASARAAVITDVPEEQHAAGCLQDARLLETVGCTLEQATVVLLDTNPDLSPDQCPG